MRTFIATFVLLFCVPVFTASGADTPGTKVRGRSSQEPPPPQNTGNPFPRNPEKPLSNPLRDDRRNLNPQNDPDVQRGIRENYQRHHNKKN